MAKEPDFVSPQTYDARRFYLDLQPSSSHPLTVVCGGVERMNDDYVVQRDDFPFFAIEWVSEGIGLLTIARQRLESVKVSSFLREVALSLSLSVGLRYNSSQE